MSLAALQNVETSLAKGALASTVISIAGHGLESVPPRYASLSRALVDEARARLKLGSDESDRAWTAIRTFLSEEVDRQIFSGVDRNALKLELGAAGTLPLGAYNVTFTDGYDEGFKENKKFIERAMRTADRIDHRELAGDGLEIDRGASLFAKLVLSTDKKRSNILLIDAMRIQNNLTINKVWRLFPEVLNLDKASSPFDMLEIFVSHYGIEVEYSGIGKAKLFENLRIPTIFGSPEEISDITVLHGKDSDYMHVETGSSAYSSDDDGNERRVESFVLLSYAIDMRMYKSDARKFG